MSVIRRVREEISRQYGHRFRYSRRLDRLNRQPLLRDFVARYRGAFCFSTRETMWDHLAGHRETEVDYLEFGVHEGHSILYWAMRNVAPGSRFVGFDTFEGLPEHWGDAFPKGHFDTAGKAPDTDDRRVTFVKGLFQETLPGFLASYSPRNARRIVHIDCDLYSSTLYCLTQIDRFLTPGTLVIFDEFGDVQHEFRAFNDYCASYRRQFRLVCAHDDYFTAALEAV